VQLYWSDRKRHSDSSHSQWKLCLANFSIACGDDYKNKAGEKVEQTNWINVVAFGKLAEIIGKYCGKGSKIYINGKMVTRKWQSSDGTDKYTTEVIANDMQLGPKDNAQPNQQRAAPSNQPPNQDYDGPAF